MTEHSKARLHVLLDDPSALSPLVSKVARVVARVQGEPLPDVIGRVRYGGGIVARDLLPSDAREVCRGLAALGLGTFTAASERFRSAPRPRRTGSVLADAEGLELAPRLRAPQRLPWERVRAINAYGLLVELGSDERSALPRRGGDLTSLSPPAVRLIDRLRELEARQRCAVYLAIDVLADGPQLYRLASDEPGLYARLDGRRDHTIDNYLLLLERLLATAPAAVFVPAGTRRLVEGELDPALFAKPEELDRFNAWLLEAAEQGVDSEDEAEDLADEHLADADEAIVVGGHLSDEGAEDLDADDSASDDDEEDLEDDEEDDDELADGTASLADDDPELEAELDALRRAGSAEADADLDEGLGLFAQTRRLGRAEVAAILADVTETDGVDMSEIGDAHLDAEVRETAQFFEQSSGPWDVSKLLEGEDELDDEDLEEAEATNG